MRKGAKLADEQRRKAKARGDAKYFTGVPCCRGHLADRATINGRCMACAREDAKKYYDADPEGHRTRHAGWKNRSKDHLREYSARRREKLGVSVRDQLRKWRQDNPEKAKAHDRNCRARRKNAAGKHTAEDIRQIVISQRGRCAYCPTRLTFRNREIDHIEPLSKGGTNYRRNIQVLCRPCNQRKRDKHPIEFSRSLGLLL